MPTRYDGKPFLRLLELYVLWAMGSLSKNDAENLERMTPKLHETYNRAGRWQDIIAADMEFSTSMPESVREVWVKNSAIARANNVNLDPQQFAETFVDLNFAD